MGTLRYTLLEPSQRELLCEGIARVYGDTYPIAEFYDPQYLRSAMGDGLLYSVVAMDEQGRVQACMSTLLESVGERTADGSALLVAPHCRGQGVVAQLGHHMVATYERLNLCGLHLYALALHAKVQNQSGSAGAGVTGILPAWFSRRARVSGYAFPDARIGAVCMLMPLGEFPDREVHLPSMYSGVISDIYRSLPLVRTQQVARTGALIPEKCALQVTLAPQNLQRRLLLLFSGQDFEDRLDAQLVQAAQAGEEVCYLDLSLDDPGVASAVPIARARGFFFGGLMVERRGTDRLRLQRYSEKLAAPQHMVLASAEARTLMQLVLDDQSSVCSAQI